MSDREAIENIESGEFDAVLVGGAVEDTSRQIIQLASDERSINVIEVEKGDKVIETYPQNEIFPKLHESSGKTGCRAAIAYERCGDRETA